MTPSSDRGRAEAWEAARLLLDATGLSTYLFRVDPDGGDFVVDVEHPHLGAWRRLVLHVGGDELLRALDDRRHRTALAARWRAQLRGRDAA